MLNRSTLLIIATVMTLGFASQALAQSFNPRDGTGGIMPFSYGQGGERAPWTVGPQNNSPAAAPQIGGKLYNYVAPRFDRSGNHSR
jgi:hypothetical protein